jgi:outer membrane immunogenic protein
MLAMAVAAAPAGAADLPRRGPVAPIPAFAPVYNWTGFYLGVNGGWGFGKSRWDSANSFSVDGGVVGGTVGYNWQTGQAVFGLEGDLDWSDIKGSTNTFCAVGCRTSNSWLSTVRGRLGFAFDRVLPFVTGGLAIGDIVAAVPGLPGGDATRAGWTIGAGVEWAFAGTWSLKGEYLYVDLGKFNCGLNCGGATVDNVSFNTHLVRGGVNFRF